MKNRIRIAFATPEGQRQIGATLVSIGRGGALVVADKQMRLRRAFVCGSRARVRTDWVDAKAVRFDSGRGICLQFPHGSPEDFVLADTVGVDLAFPFRDTADDTTVQD